MNNPCRVTFVITYYIDQLKVKVHVSSFVWKTCRAKCLIYIYIRAPRRQGAANFACMAPVTSRGLPVLRRDGFLERY